MRCKTPPFVVDGQISGGFAQGLGIACQPSFLAAEAIKAGTLVRVLADFSVPEIAIYAVYPGNRFLPQRVKHFVDFLVTRLNPGRQDLPYWDREI